MLNVYDVSNIVSKLSNDIESYIDDIKQICENRNIDISNYSVAMLHYNNDKASELYISRQIKICNKYNIKCKPILINNKDELISTYNSLNEDKNIIGIILAKPLPKEWNVSKDLESNIKYYKDIESVGLKKIYELYTGCKNFHMPCTAEAVSIILQDICKNDNISGKSAVVIGRSNTVGKPIALMLLNLNTTVTICHSYTDYDTILDLISKADIIITALDKPEYIPISICKDNSIVIDVGTCYNIDNKLVGNVYVDCTDTDKNITLTPVPGGVGKITQLTFILNIVREWRNNLIEKD